MNEEIEIGEYQADDEDEAIVTFLKENAMIRAEFVGLKTLLLQQGYELENN